jgi:hypothetical protein
LFNAPGADGAGLGVFLDGEMFDWKGGEDLHGVKWDSVFVDEEYEDVFCVDLEEVSGARSGALLRGDRVRIAALRLAIYSYTVGTKPNANADANAVLHKRRGRFCAGSS